jgi:hypothetical protein
MLNVIVERSKWYRGQGSDGSALLIAYEMKGGQNVGRMCCLGFACLAAGLAVGDIAGKPCPSNVLKEWRDFGNTHDLDEKLPAPLMNLVTIDDGFIGDSDLCQRMTETNDAPAGDTAGEDSIADDAEREERLIELGREAGINFTFVD